MKCCYKMSVSLLPFTIAATLAPGITSAQDLALEEVVVTAQKRAESLQDVPVSVSAMSDADLEGLKLRNSTEIASQVPNLQIQTPFGDTQPYLSLRGVSTSDYSHNQSSPVAMYVDETYKSVGALQALQLYDLARVEVLRGPQGSLYGKNATGGAVNFITKKPTYEETGYLTLGVGNYGKKEAKGAYQLPLIDDTLSMRTAFTVNKMDGWVENKLPGATDEGQQDEWAARVSFLYTPSDDIEAVLRFQKSESDSNNYGVYAKDVQSWVGVDRSGLDFHENRAQGPSRKKLSNRSASLAVNWDINEQYTLTSITAYDKGRWLTTGDDDGLEISLDENDYASEAKQVTQEFRITSAYDGPFNWIGGLYWGKDEVDSIVHYRFFDDMFLAAADGGFDAYGFNEYNSFTQIRSSIATFLHSTYDLSESLSLTFGLRYTKDKTEVEDFYALAGYLDDARSNGGTEYWTQTIGDYIGAWTTYTPGLSPKGEVLPDFDFDDENVSAKIGIDWRLNNDVMFYASFSQGYRSSAVNGQAFLDVSELTIVDPEEVDAWEVGIKSQLLDNRVQLNGAAFYYDYTNQQFLTVTDSGLQVLVNADKSKIKGAELEAIALLSENLTLRAGLGYLDAEYEELVLGGEDLSGNDLISAPELNFNTMLDWKFATTDLGTFTFHVDTVFTDDQFFDAPNTETTGQESYWITNARLTLDAADDSYSVALWAKNIADEEYFVYGLPLEGFGLGFNYMMRGQPRTFGAEFTYRFN